MRVMIKALSLTEYILEIPDQSKPLWVKRNSVGFPDDFMTREIQCGILAFW
jgi:hypothetical protein